MSTANADEFLAIADAGVTDVAALMERTHPMLPLAWWKRIAHDKGLIADEMPAAERALGVREPFQVLEYLGHRTRAWRGRVAGLAVAVGILGLGSLGIFGAWLGQSHRRYEPVVLPWVCFTGGWAVVIALSTAWIVMARKRIVKRQILPMLGRALRPLRPSEAELTDVFDWMKKSRHVLAGVVSQDEVLAEVKRVPDRSFSTFDADTLLRMAQEKEFELEDSRRRQLPGVLAPGRDGGEGDPGTPRA